MRTKWQEKATLDSILFVLFCMCVFILWQKLWHTAVSVSYTHLDVYKRQKKDLVHMKRTVCKCMSYKNEQGNDCKDQEQTEENYCKSCVRMIVLWSDNPASFTCCYRNTFASNVSHKNNNSSMTTILVQFVQLFWTYMFPRLCRRGSGWSFTSDGDLFIFI